LLLQLASNKSRIMKKPKTNKIFYSLNLLFSVIIVLFGCNTKENNNSYTTLDSISLNVGFKDINNRIGFGLYNTSEKSGFYLIDNNNLVRFYENNKEVFSKNISGFSERIDGIAYDAITENLYIISNNSLFQFDKKNNQKKIKVSQLADNYNLGALTFDIQPKVYNNNFIFNIIKTGVKIDEETSYKEFWKSSTVLKGTIKNDTAENLMYTGNFPSNYINNYNNYYSNIEFDGTNLLMSYSSNDTVFVQNEKNEINRHYLGSENVKSDIEPIPFDDLQINSRISTYTRNSAKYIKIIYDPYKKEYLRIYQMKNKELQNTVNNWGIVFYDKNFKFIRDIKFDSKDYIYLVTSPSANGLIISRALKDYANDKIKLQTISFN
jgi:hypothetical protein